MAYESDSATLIPIPFYSNPFVPIFGVDTDGTVGSISCLCCVQGGDTAANALVMQENALNTVNGKPSFTDEATGGFGLEHWPSVFNDYPPNFGANGLTNPQDNWHFTFPNRAGVAQYRCRTIPYDCNQNGYLDTLEFDGVAPNGNADGLTDFDNDRVPDGCFPRECFSAPSLTGSTPFAISTFEPQAPEDAGDRERLFGQGGTFVDNGIYESDLRLTPERNGPEDIYWAYEVSELQIDGLVHPRFTDLTIELVRQDLYGDEETWTVLDCSGLEGQSGVSTTLAGNYTFALSGRPESPEDYPAATTLSGRDLCNIASSGQYPNLLPAGTYRPSNDLIEFESIPFNERWFLRITDSNAGVSGFFSRWSLKMKVLPYDEDCNQDGSPDTCFDAFSFDSDCDSNFVADSCDIASDPLVDCDANGVLDVCEDTSFLVDLGGTVWDANSDGLDTLTNGVANGFVDENGNFIDDDTDFIREVLGCADYDPAGICEPNCRPDLCDITQTPALDFNQNFILDCAEEDTGGQCPSRVYRSVTFGNTGEGLILSDLSISESTIEVTSVEDDVANSNSVIEGATVLGSVVVSLHDLEHPRLADLQITLIHQSGSGTRVTNLLLFACDGPGYLESGSTTYTFRTSGATSLCVAAQQPGPIPKSVPGEPTDDYLPVEGSFGEHVGANAVGSWTIQIFDGVFGEQGSLGAWDLEFIHRPPDFDNNGTPDVCE
jgi:subtilisin-like proprotein convertase family protein